MAGERQFCDATASLTPPAEGRKPSCPAGGGGFFGGGVFFSQYVVAERR